MLVRNAPLDGGALTSGPDGDPVAGPGSSSVGQPRDAATLPCQEAEDADLWFADAPTDLERAKQLCGGCPIRAECLAGALRRAEPWGVWGGEIFQRGQVIARKRPRGRPSKAALARDRALAATGARL